MRKGMPGRLGLRSGHACLVFAQKVGYACHAVREPEKASLVKGWPRTGAFSGKHHHHVGFGQIPEPMWKPCVSEMWSIFIVSHKELLPFSEDETS